MRSVLVVLALVGSASADPISVDVLRRRTRDPDAAVRARAAEQLARLRGSEVAIGIIASSVISDDPAVRGPLLDALVRERVIPKAGAIHVPTASVLGRMIPRLYPKRTGRALPEPTSCSVTGGTERGATLVCTISSCESAMHVTIVFELATGVRWRGAEPRRNAVMDGSCGDIM